MVAGNSCSFTASATTALYPLSLHDALPILAIIALATGAPVVPAASWREAEGRHVLRLDRKSTRLNSSHITISYAVCCLKKKNAVSVVSVRFSQWQDHCAHLRIRFHDCLRGF